MQEAPTKKQILEPIKNNAHGREGARKYSTRPSGNSKSPTRGLNKQQALDVDRGQEYVSGATLRQDNRKAPQAKKNAQAYLDRQLEAIMAGGAGMDIDDRLDVDVMLQPDERGYGVRHGLADCRSTLDYILESLSQSLGMNQSQAAALLANNQKFLVHMSVKGMKGRDYSRILNWYRLILQSTQTLVGLLELERGDSQALGMTMNVIKCGLLSEDSEVANLCARALNKVCGAVHDRSSQQEDATSLISVLWDWFIVGQTVLIQRAKAGAQSSGRAVGKAAKK